MNCFDILSDVLLLIGLHLIDDRYRKFAEELV